MGKDEQTEQSTTLQLSFSDPASESILVIVGKAPQTYLSDKDHFPYSVPADPPDPPAPPPPIPVRQGSASFSSKGPGLVGHWVSDITTHFPLAE